MKERPILYSSPMVLAKLAGRKTQTRRVVKARHLDSADRWAFDPERGEWESGEVHQGPTAHVEWVRCPYGVLGDRLWGRETHVVLRIRDATVVAYRATCDNDSFGFVDPRANTIEQIEVKKWTPSIFMRRQYSRILDEVVSVRVERLQDISEADAIAEGLEMTSGPHGTSICWRWPTGTEEYPSARHAYFAGWKMLNGEESLNANPWVWRIETKPVSP